VKKRSLHWAHLQTLAAVVRTTSKSAAARELGLTHATVGRRLRDLEAALGSALFENGESGLALTATGRAALATAEAMDDSAAALARQLQGTAATVGGRVRLTCTEGIGTELLPRHLPALLQRHPGLELELLVDPRTLSLARRRADMAIRLARPQDPGLVVRHLADLPYLLCCAPAVAEAMQRALRGEAPLPLCHFDASLAELPESRWLDEHLPQARTALSSNSLRTLAQACAAGVGIALLPAFAARQFGLTALPSAATPERPVWLAYPEEYRHTPRYRAVADWIGEIFRDERQSLLTGVAG